MYDLDECDGCARFGSVKVIGNNSYCSYCLTQNSSASVVTKKPRRFTLKNLHNRYDGYVKSCKRYNPKDQIRSFDSWVVWVHGLEHM